jgi:Uma2 family endonuclease
MYDLPSESPEDTGLPDEFHRVQAELLCQTFQPATYPADRIFVASDMNLYYDSQNRGYYKRPDWFGVVDVPRKVDDGRLSYVRWQERHSPMIIVELLSPSTIEEDQGETKRGCTPPSKWEVYESILRVPYYVLFDRMATTFRIFELQGTTYQELSEDRLWIDALGIGLGVWSGGFSGDVRQWLRWYDAEGNWIPTLEEQRQQAEIQRQQAEIQRQQAEIQSQQAEVQRQQAEIQRQQAEQRADQAETELAEERQRNALLADRLRALGIDPENL